MTRAHHDVESSILRVVTPELARAFRFLRSPEGRQYLSERFDFAHCTSHVRLLCDNKNQQRQAALDERREPISATNKKPQQTIAKDKRFSLHLHHMINL